MAAWAQSPESKPQVPGASAEDQKHIDELRAMIAREMQFPGAAFFGYFEDGKMIGTVIAVTDAGNYTKPGIRKALFNQIKNSATQGTAAGQWSARKA